MIKTMWEAICASTHINLWRPLQWLLVFTIPCYLIAGCLVAKYLSSWWLILLLAMIIIEKTIWSGLMKTRPELLAKIPDEEE